MFTWQRKKWQQKVSDAADSIAAAADGPVSSATGKTWLNGPTFTAMLALMVIAGYPDVVFGFSTFFFRDFLQFGYPIAYYHKLQIAAAHIPLWNPLNNCGLPFLAQWNTMTFYPGSIIYLLLPLPWSLNLFVLLHQIFAGLGMFFWPATGPAAPWLPRWPGPGTPSAAWLNSACNGPTILPAWAGCRG